MTEGEKEQRKLTANWLNIIAAGIVVTGAIAPLIAYVLGTVPNDAVSPYIFVGGCVGSVVVGSALNLIGRHLLGRL